MIKRNHIPKKTETDILVSSRRRCAICFGLHKNDNVKSGQIAHIDRDCNNNSFSNLVFLCLEHHDAYDSRNSQTKGYTPAELKHYRDELYDSIVLVRKDKQSGNASTTSRIQLIDEELLSCIWHDIENTIIAGYIPPDDIAAEVIEMYSEEYNVEVITPFIQATTNELLKVFKKQQVLWPKITDCDRLDLAFAELQLNGILSRQNFADCLTCGYSEIWSEIEKSIKDGNQVRGFTFFHMQDVEHAIYDGQLALGYGSLFDVESADIEIAREVVDTLQRHSLKVDWTNTINQRIIVSMDWKKRH